MRVLAALTALGLIVLPGVARAEVACAAASIPRGPEFGFPTNVCVTLPAGAWVTRPACRVGNWNSDGQFRCGPAGIFWTASGRALCIAMTNWSSRDRIVKACAEYTRLY
jgi:hypothetical protein